MLYPHNPGLTKRKCNLWDFFEKLSSLLFFYKYQDIPLDTICIYKHGDVPNCNKQIYYAHMQNNMIG